MRRCNSQARAAGAAEWLLRCVTKAVSEEGTKRSRQDCETRRGELTRAWVNDRGGKLGQDEERGRELGASGGSTGEAARVLRPAL